MKKETAAWEKEQQPFRSLYWRQMALTIGMVLLTLALLGIGFFAMSYNYVRSETANAMREKADVVAQIAAAYIQDGEIARDQDFQTLARFASSTSENNFLICAADGTALLTTDDSLSGLSFRLPEDIMEKLRSEGSYSGTGTLGGIYEVKQFLVAVPILSFGSGGVSGSGSGSR